MLLILLRAAYLFICAGAIAGYFYSGQPLPYAVQSHEILWFFILLGITQIVPVVDISIRRKRPDLRLILRAAHWCSAGVYDD